MTSYTLLTPGPTPLPDEVYREIAKPILHHRTTEFRASMKRVFEDLKYVFQTQECEPFILSSSGTGALEAAVINFFNPGEKVLIAAIGSFGERWASIAQNFGIDAQVIKEEWGNAADPDKVEDILKKNPDIKGIFVTHVETSTGTLNNIKAFGNLAVKYGALLLIDAVSSLAGEEFCQDLWHVDVCVSGSQKGLMCPPGLALISVSKKALNKMKTVTTPRFYWDLNRYVKAKTTDETPFTPPVQLIAALSVSLNMIKKETLPARYARIKELSEFTRNEVTDRFKAEFFSKSPANILTAFKLPKSLAGNAITSTQILKTIRENRKISIADGQGPQKGKLFRIAHIGAITKEDVKKGLDALSEHLSHA
ncbi:pyridoxal-phosphate-dependent aminotransferase family protein [Elusimicrobiota bacterium]